MKSAFDEILPNVELAAIRLVRPQATWQAALCLGRPPFSALEETRASYLHPREIAQVSSLKCDQARTRFLAGRYCAKRAVGALAPELDLVAISIASGVFNQPVVKHAGGNIQVSITHAGEWGGAIAFPEEHPMGIDLEEVNPDQAEAIASQMTRAEISLPRFVATEIQALTLLWTAKEALSKTLRCGMMTPFAIFEIAGIHRDGAWLVSTFVNFAQYKAVSFLLTGAVVSIICPKNTTPEFRPPIRLKVD